MSPRAPEPDWSLGACVTHPHPDWWSAPSPAERKAATYVCAGCQILEACRDWAIAMLPVSDRSVWGGLLAADRIRVRQQLRKREAARLAAQRASGRRSEARRRQLGKAPTTKERYANGEAEMFKASAASYYERNNAEVRARRRARHERSKDGQRQAPR